MNHRSAENYIFSEQGVEDIARLPKKGSGTGDAVVVVNATGSAESEVFARAWCCHVGTNFVIRKLEAERSCLKCALMVASTEGLDMGVLIVC